MAEYPAMPLFTDAYLGDTHHLTLEESGAYLKLLMIAWRTPGCCLPDDDKRLATMLGVTIKRWRERLRPVIEPFWIVEDGKWTQKKQQKVRKKVKKSSEQKRNAYLQTERAKRLRKNETDEPADLSTSLSVDPPADNLTKTKESRNLGLEHRSLRPGRGPPAAAEPDPEKITMTLDWKLERDAQTLLEDVFVPILGVDSFWRQVARFIDHHCRRSTIDTQEGFTRSLENWLKRANANREKIA